MAKTWCSNCGNCITFENKKPNFCFGCGEPMGGVARAKTEVQELDEPEEDEPPLPKNKIILEVKDIDYSGVSIEDILANPTIVPIGGSKGSRTSLKQIRKKCQSKDPIEI